MSELKRIITMQVTMISNADAASDKESVKASISDAVKECLGADDVNVLNVQDFLLDER